MTTATLPTLTGAYVADPDHSSFGFAVRHMGVSVFRGSFDDVAATLRTEGGALVLRGVAQVDSISIRRPQAFRDHVLAPDFFAVDDHPEVHYASSAVALDPDGRARVSGELTIRGVTRPVDATGTWVADVEDPFGGVRSALELSAVVDRRDFGMTWNAPLPKGGDALANEVTLTVHLELVRDEG